jgi:hypothetical protein
LLLSAHSVNIGHYTADDNSTERKNTNVIKLKKMKTKQRTIV